MNLLLYNIYMLEEKDLQQIEKIVRNTNIELIREYMKLENQIRDINDKLDTLATRDELFKYADDSITDKINNDREVIILKRRIEDLENEVETIKESMKNHA